MARAKRAVTPKRKKAAERASTHAPRPKPARSARAEAAVERAYDRVRALCMAHAGVYEKEAWATPTFRVERGKMFLMFADNHHGDGRVAFWCMSTPDSREAWLGMDPERFFVPPYVGPSGWIGARLEGAVPWDAIAEIVAEGYRMAAPKPPAPRRRRA